MSILIMNVLLLIVACLLRPPCECVAFSATPTAAAAAAAAAAYRKEQNLAQASIEFRRASELDPSNIDARYGLGQVLSEMGYIDDAVDVFRELIAKDEDDVVTDGKPSRYKISLANILLDGRGEKKEALLIYRQCLSQNVKSAMGLLAGIVLDSMGNHEEAEECYKNLSKTQNLEEVEQDVALYWMLSKIRQGNGADAAILRGRLLDYARTTVDYVMSTSLKHLESPIYYWTFDMIQLALQNCKEMEKGLILEFGVYHGKTLRMIASRYTDRDVHGFDTFTGIPEDWHATPSGSYSTHGTVPSAPNNVQYHVGLFSDTLPLFLERHEGPIQFMNTDCDLYSSTKDVLDAIHDRIVIGTVIVFDEYVMNPNWMKDEYKAFQEAVQKYGWEYEYIAISVATGQAIVRITNASTADSSK